MAITANVDLGNGVSKSNCYIIIPNAYVKKFQEEWYTFVKEDKSTEKVVTSAASFKLIYDVSIYKDKDDKNSETSLRQSKLIKCNEVDHHKIDYDPTSGEQNAFKLAYAHLKTNSKLSSVADA